MVRIPAASAISVLYYLYVHTFRSNDGRIIFDDYYIAGRLIHFDIYVKSGWAKKKHAHTNAHTHSTDIRRPLTVITKQTPTQQSRTNSPTFHRTFNEVTTSPTPQSPSEQQQRILHPNTSYTSSHIQTPTNLPDERRCKKTGISSGAAAATTQTISVLRVLRYPTDAHTQHT